MISSKKSCIVHNTDPETCGCPDSVSQADSHRTERVMHMVPTFLGMPPDGYEGDLNDTGPFIWVEETVREYGKYGRNSTSFMTRTVSFAKMRPCQEIADQLAALLRKRRDSKK